MAFDEIDSRGINALDKTYLTTKAAFASFAIFITGMALLSLFGSYGYWWLQSVRGPSVIYFNIALICALFSRRKATILLIFCLPLLPTLHYQLELILHPRVKYFISYPGIDAIAGFCSGVYFRHVVETRTWLIKKATIPWPFGLLLFVLTMSTALAITRNLWQSATPFTLLDLGYNILRFKVMDKANDYAPIADLLVYSFAGLVAIVILNTIQGEKDKDSLFFKPIIYGVIVSACWGFFQAYSSFGLSDLTRKYRQDEFGFGAEGFQPDIHAFAGHMLIGAVGLSGYLVYNASGRMRYLATFASILGWIAIVLSKSRASLLFAVLLTIVFGLFVLKSRRTQSSKGFLIPVLLLALVTASAFVASYYFWLGAFFSELENTDISNFETVNLLLRWRLEFHRAALLMFEAFPWMGVGQGNFFRLSTILELTHSNWLAERPGNNAHNYFLQTLAETGVIGVGSFILVFVWPLFNVSDRKKLVPAIMLILSVFLGNIYSHSLLIRENLYLLSIFIAFMYALTYESLASDVTQASRSVRSNTMRLFVALFIIAIASYFVAVEVASSFYKMPFKYAGHCHLGATVEKNCDGQSSIIESGK